MYTSAKEAYLKTQVATATPQRLRLMLIEAGIRKAEQTVQGWHAESEEREAEAFEAAFRCREIITELLAGIRPDQNPLTHQVFDIYLFLFQHVTEAINERSSVKMLAVRDVLLEERMTWQALCELHPEVVQPADGKCHVPEEIAAPKTLTGTPWAAQTAEMSPAAYHLNGGGAERFSFDA